MSREIPTYPLLIEESSNYAFTVRRIAKPLSFDKLRNTSNRFYNDLPEEIRDELHNSEIGGGLKIIQKGYDNIVDVFEDCESLKRIIINEHLYNYFKQFEKEWWYTLIEIRKKNGIIYKKFGIRRT